MRIDGDNKVVTIARAPHDEDSDEEDESEENSENVLEEADEVLNDAEQDGVLEDEAGDRMRQAQKNKTNKTMRESGGSRLC